MGHMRYRLARYLGSVAMLIVVTTPVALADDGGSAKVQAFIALAAVFVLLAILAPVIGRPRWHALLGLIPLYLWVLAWQFGGALAEASMHAPSPPKMGDSNEDVAMARHVGQIP
jgi:hypothetical protein